MSCSSVGVKSDWIKAPVKINWTGSSAAGSKHRNRGRQCNKKIKIIKMFFFFLNYKIAITL